MSCSPTPRPRGRSSPRPIEEYKTALELKAKKPNDLKVKLAKAQLGLGERDAAKATSTASSRPTPNIPRPSLRQEIEHAKPPDEQSRTEFIPFSAFCATEKSNRGGRNGMNSVLLPWVWLRLGNSHWQPHRLFVEGECDRERRRLCPPNVVLIIADDMGWTDFGFMGHPQIRTPGSTGSRVQSLAFQRGHVTSSLCSPTLASILTDSIPTSTRSPATTLPCPPGETDGAARHPAFLAQRQEMIKAFDAMPTLPRLLASKGYLSFQAGKWWGGSYRAAASRMA